MNEERERVERLREFGLSDYATRAYLALLELGSTEAREVSRLARVPVAKIYSTLDSLAAKGLVTVSPETPRRYHPVPFAEFVDRLRARHLEQAAALQAERARLEELFPIVGTAQIDDRGGILTVRGRPNAYERMRDAVAQAREEVLFVASRGALLRPTLTHQLLADARRGVARRVLLPAEEGSADALRALPAGVEVRARSAHAAQAMSVGLLLCDARTAIMVHHVPDDARVTSGQDVAVVVSQPAHVSMLHALALPLWESARPLSPGQRA